MANIPAELMSSLMAATEEVFATMVLKPLVRRPVGEGQVAPIAGPAVVATVPFAGHRRGLVAIHSSLAAAKGIAGSMLGIPTDALNGEIPDAMGEVANMVAGTFRNKLAKVEPASAISVPTVTMGSDFSTTYFTPLQRAHCPFDMDGQSIFVELILTGGERRKTTRP